MTIGHSSQYVAFSLMKPTCQHKTQYLNAFRHSDIERYVLFGLSNTTWPMFHSATSETRSFFVVAKEV